VLDRAITGENHSSGKRFWVSIFYARRACCAHEWQRANVMLEHERAGLPPLLNFEHELVG
jgi:hypothetical protein